MSLLFPELDRQATLDRVAHFFKYDLDQLLLMAGKSLTDISSPSLSQAPGGSPIGNSMEQKLIRGVNAEAMINAVIDTINHCPHNSQVILMERFIKRKSWVQVQSIMYSSHYKFSYLRRRAMYDFANSFDYWQRVHKCEPILDLHVYLEEELVESF